MTAKVIPFPIQAGPNSAEVANRIRACLRALSDDGDMVEHIVGRIMAFIEKYTCKTIEPYFNLPLRPMSEEETKVFLTALDDGVETIATQVCDMVNQIIMERLFLEVEIYQLTRGLKNTDVLGVVPDLLAKLPKGYREKVSFLASELKNPGLKAHERYLLNKLLASVLAANADAVGQTVET